MVQLTAEFLPGTRGGVSVTDRRDLAWPRYGQLWVVVSYGDVFGWIMGPIDAVANIGVVSKDLKAVEQPRGDVQVPETLIVEAESFVLSKGWRIRASVYQDIVNGASGAAHQLRLTATRPPMQTADYAESGPGLGVLPERGGVDAVRRRDRGIERSGEESTVVMVRGGDEHPDALERCQPNLHRDIVPATGRRRC